MFRGGPLIGSEPFRSRTGPAAFLTSFLAKARTSPRSKWKKMGGVLVLLVFEHCSRDRDRRAGARRFTLEAANYFHSLVVILLRQFAEDTGDIEIRTAGTAHRRAAFGQQTESNYAVFTGKTLGAVGCLDGLRDCVPTLSVIHRVQGIGDRGQRPWAIRI